HRPDRTDRSSGCREAAARPGRRSQRLARVDARLSRLRAEVRGARGRARRVPSGIHGRGERILPVLRIHGPHQVRVVNQGARRGRDAVVRDFAVASVPWAIARVLVVASLALSRHIFDEVGRGPRPVPLGQGLFAWDAAYYRAIAEHGYDSLPKAALRFFPLV